MGCPVDASLVNAHIIRTEALHRNHDDVRLLQRHGILVDDPACDVESLCPLVVQERDVRSSQGLFQVLFHRIVVFLFVKTRITDFIVEIGVDEPIGPVAGQFHIAHVVADPVPPGIVRHFDGQDAQHQNGAAPCQGPGPAFCFKMPGIQASLKPGQKSRRGGNRRQDDGHVERFPDLADHFLRINKIIDGNEIEIRMEFLPVQIQCRQRKDHKGVHGECHRKHSPAPCLPVQPARRQKPEQQGQRQREEDAGRCIVDQPCQERTQQIPGRQGHHVQRSQEIHGAQDGLRCHVRQKEEGEAARSALPYLVKPLHKQFSFVIWSREVEMPLFRSILTRRVKGGTTEN